MTSLSKMETVLEAMKTCEQAAGVSVLQHGLAVREAFTLLVGHIQGGAPLPSWWRLPSWCMTPGLLDQLPSESVMEEYQVYHDCGKPFCRQVGEDGAIHFPDHASRSESIWRAAGGHPIAASLMGMDMDAHKLRADGLAEFASRPFAVALLLTAVAEVHANAAMFGGADSNSFKIKAKHLDKRGRQVLALMSQA